MKLKKLFGFVFLSLFLIVSVNAITTNNSNLMAYWDFDNLSDLSGNGRDLTLGTNPPTKLTGASCQDGTGSCYSCDGSNDYMTNPYRNVTTKFTINFWRKSTSTANAKMYGMSSGTDSFRIYANSLSTGNTRIFSYFGGNGYDTSASVPNYNDGTWHFISYVADLSSGTMLYYQDGVLLSPTINTSSATPAAYVIGRDPGMCAANNDGTFDSFAQLVIDDFSIFNTTLTQSEIQDIYNNGITGSTPSPTITIDNNTVSDYFTFNSTFNRYYINNSISLNTTLSVTNTNSNVNGTFYIYNQTGSQIFSNQYITNNLTGNITYSGFTTEQIYRFNATYENNETSTVETGSFIFYDTTPPNVSVLSNTTEFNEFSINFSNVFNVTDSFAGIHSCFINITELDNVTTPDNFYINCTDTQVFSTAGLHNANVTAIDKAGNYQTLSWNFTVNPFVYVSFLDPLGANITNYSVLVTHPDGRNVTYSNTNNPITLSPVNDGVLDLGNHTLQFTKTGYTTQNFIIDINESSVGNFSFNASYARILLYIRNQDTGAIINDTTFDVEFIATVGTNTSTSTGLVNITNLFFLNEEYFAVITNADYQTETLTFDFTNRENIVLTAYMIDSNNTNLGVVFVKPVDNFGNPIVGAITKALQWDSATSSYKEVSSAITGSDGLGTLNVLLNDKVYIFTASSGANTGQTSSEIIDSTENGKTITIALQGLAQEYEYLLENVLLSASETFNNVTNISTITFNYDSSIGAIDVCINSYRVLRGTEQQLTENCITGTSGQYVLQFNVNNSYLTVLKTEIKVDSVLYTHLSFEHQPLGSFASITEDMGLNILIVPLLFLCAIALAMLIENVYIGTFLMMVFGGISLGLAPNILTKGIVAFLLFIGWVTINYGVKSR